MPYQALIVYLNDHLAGSTAALQLLDNLHDTAEGLEDRRFFEALRSAVSEDRETLLRVMRDVGGRESAVRHAGGWIAERVLQLKLAYDGAGDRALAALEALELLALGILGKRALWRALAAAAPGLPNLKDVDFEHLMERAGEQHDRVEACRLDWARKAFGGLTD
jgi:hypothetical protein